MEIHYSRQGLLELLRVDELAARIGLKIRGGESGKYYCNVMLKRRVREDYPVRSGGKVAVLTDILVDTKRVLKGVFNGNYTPSQN